MSESLLRHALRNLRHLYEQMLVPGRVQDTANAARGLLAPAIEYVQRADAELTAPTCYACGAYHQCDPAAIAASCNCEAIRAGLGASEAVDLIGGHEPDCVATNFMHGERA